jgi:hypothetical protein
MRRPEMGFVKDAAKVGTFGLAGLLASHKKKPAASLVAPQPTMISTTPYERPMSMIQRGG